MERAEMLWRTSLLRRKMYSLIAFYKLLKVL
jgi:hypothetical protein